MGLSTLAGHRITHARVSLPDWGCWYADASIDGDHELAGDVELKISDLTLRGHVLAGGPTKAGRSHYWIVGGKGGWGKTAKHSFYADDAGVKVKKIVDDAARAAGETVDAATIPNTRIGPKYTRAEGPPSVVLSRVAPRGWYVGEDGITRFGRRARAPLSVKATIGTFDRARRKVTIAADSVATILPGVIVDGVEAVDVEHVVTPDELRSTLWGINARGTSRRIAAYERMFEMLDPGRHFRGLTEYRVVSRTGKRLNLQVVRVSTGMPDMIRVAARPGVAGADPAPTPGSRVLVTFVDGDPSRPCVVGYDEIDAEGFAPTTLDLLAAGMVGGEHVATVEGMTVLIHNVIFLLSQVPGLPAAWAASGVITGVINAALGATAAPVPPGEVAQIAAAPAVTTAMLTGVGHTVAPYLAAIAGLAGKVANASGLFPSLGAKGVKSG